MTSTSTWPEFAAKTAALASITDHDALERASEEALQAFWPAATTAWVPEETNDICWSDEGVRIPFPSGRTLCATGAPPPDATHAVRSLFDAVHALAGNLDMYVTLETLVAQEMTKVVMREEEVRLILDSMNDGLVVCDRDGSVTEVRSRAIEQWFGDPADRKIWHLLFGDDEEQQASFAMNYEQLTDGFLPFELAADQMQRRITLREQSFDLRYAPVGGDDDVSRVVITVTDVSARAAAERVELLSRELATVVQHVLKDRREFGLAIDDIERMLGELDGAAVDAVFRRTLHTLKGNAGILGFDLFARACHSVETDLDSTAVFTEEHRALLSGEWNDARSRIAMFLEQRQRGIRVHTHEYEAVVEQLEERKDCALLPVVERWRHPTFDAVLQSTFRASQRIARKLNRAVEIASSGADVRIADRAHESVLRTLVHVANNAIAHGAEPAEARRAAGKPPHMTIHVDVEQDEKGVRIVIRDDGRGVDWGAVADRAESRGLAHATVDDLERALWSDQFSTREQADQHSGRGVGLAAVAASVSALGGTYQLESELGEGTRIQILLPARFADARPLSEAPAA